MTTNDLSLTYPIGRFTIDMLPGFKLAARTQQYRYAEIKEFEWKKSDDSTSLRTKVWDQRLAEVAKQYPLKGNSSPVIEVRDIQQAGHWAKAMLFYRDKDTTDEGDWELLVDFGRVGVWFQFNGLLTAKEDMLKWILDIARAYHPLDPVAPLPKENGFYLEHGYIALPYLEQEETYARFEGHPLGLKLEFKTTAVHKVSESGLVDRLAASLAMNFAPGVDVAKLRTGKRNVAGLHGEEVIFRGTQDGKSELSFTWLFTGKVDSGDAPKISIEMEAPDGHVEEKLIVWDALLDSIKPIGR